MKFLELGGAFLLGAVLISSDTLAADAGGNLRWSESSPTSGVYFQGTDLKVELKTANLAPSTLLTITWLGPQKQILLSESLPPHKDGTVACILPTVKATRNGVYIVKVSAASTTGEGNVLERQVVVIPKRKIPAHEFDRASPYSICGLDLDLGGMIGARKTRNPYRSEDEFAKLVDAARANGILINGILIDGPVILHDALPGSIRKGADQVIATFKDLKKRYPDLIYAEEVHQEPENWPPTPPANLFIPLAKTVDEVTTEMRASKSDVQIISPASTHVNLSLLHQLATMGGGNSPDIVAVHGYRSPCRPEFGYAEPVAAIRELFGNKPIYCNEDAVFASTPGEDNVASLTDPQAAAIEMDEVTQGIYLQRSYLNQIAAGYSLVNEFAAVENSDLSAGPFHRRPGLANYAALTEFLPHPHFVKRLTPETENLWGLQWTTDNAPVTTLWTLNKPVMVTLHSDHAVKCYDTYGNPVGEGKDITTPIGGAPLFVIGGEVTISSSQDLSAHDASPRVVLPEETEETPLAISFRGEALDLKESRIVVVVKNTSSQPQAGSIDLKFLEHAPEAWKLSADPVPSFKLDPGQTTEIPFRPVSTNPAVPFDPYHPVPSKGYLALWWAEGYEVAATIKMSDGQTLVKEQKNRLCLRGIPQLDKAAIDGDVSEWKDVPVFPELGEQKRSVELFKLYRGPNDFNPTFKMAWNPDGLLFSAEVIDDVNDTTQTGLNAWRTDSIQLGLNTHLLHPDFTDYLVLTFGADGTAVLQRDTPRFKAGPLPGLKLVVKRIEPSLDQIGKTTYEALIPWSCLQITPGVGQQIGFCAQFNESDGWWRRGWEGYFVEMGGQIIDPRFFGDLTLVK